MLAFSSLTGKPVSVELARETLKDIVGTEEHRAVPSEILKAVASHYGLRVSDMKAKSNAKPIAFPRQVAMYLCRKLTELSYPEIGRLFNDKHHSTVMHSVEKIERLAEDDAEFPQGHRAAFCSLPLTARGRAAFSARALFHTCAKIRARPRNCRASTRRVFAGRACVSSPFYWAFSARSRLLRSPTNTAKCDRLFLFPEVGFPWN